MFLWLVPLSAVHGDYSASWYAVARSRKQRQNREAFRYWCLLCEYSIMPVDMLDEALTGDMSSAPPHDISLACRGNALSVGRLDFIAERWWQVRYSPC